MDWTANVVRLPTTSHRLDCRLGPCWVRACSWNGIDPFAPLESADHDIQSFAMQGANFSDTVLAGPTTLFVPGKEREPLKWRHKVKHRMRLNRECSKPGIKMAFSEPCKELNRLRRLILGWDSPLLTLIYAGFEQVAQVLAPYIAHTVAATMKHRALGS